MESGKKETGPKENQSNTQSGVQSQKNSSVSLKENGPNSDQQSTDFGSNRIKKSNLSNTSFSKDKKEFEGGNSFLKKMKLIDIKNFLFYPLIVASICSTVFSIQQISAVYTYQKLEFPQCTMKNENRELIFIVTMIILAVVQHPLESYSKKFFMKVIPEKKFPIGSEARESKTQMMGERIFKIIMNFSCVTVLYSILSGEDCDFLDTFAGGRIVDPLYFLNYPCQKLPQYLDSFYVFKMSYHCYELIYTIIFDLKRVDFPEYMLHHFLTFILILFSYTCNYMVGGSIVMILHDGTDFTTTIFKLVVDVTPYYIQIPAYITMLVSWIYFRLWFFPVRLIGRVINQTYIWEINEFKHKLVGLLLTFLVFLFIMHIFWFYLMIKGLVKKIKNMNRISLKGNVNES